MNNATNVVWCTWQGQGMPCPYKVQPVMVIFKTPHSTINNNELPAYRKHRNHLKLLEITNQLIDNNKNSRLQTVDLMHIRHHGTTHMHNY